MADEQNSSFQSPPPSRRAKSTPASPAHGAFAAGRTRSAPVSPARVSLGGMFAGKLRDACSPCANALEAAMNVVNPHRAKTNAAADMAMAAAERLRATLHNKKP